MQKTIKAVYTAYVIATLITLAACATTTPAVDDELPDNTEQIQRISDVYDLIQKKYFEEPNGNVLVEGCINGMLSTLNCRSGYKSRDELDNLETIGSVGISIDLIDGIPKVISSVEGSDAQKKGIKNRDTLVAIDSVSVIGRPLDDIMERLYGKAGTKARISIVHDGQIIVRNYTIERQKYQPQKVISKIFQQKWGYIRIKNFYGETAKETHAALKSMLSSENVSLKGIILDLRDNPGGKLNSAIETACIFLKPNLPIVSLKGRYENEKTFYSHNTEDSPEVTKFIETLNPTNLLVLVSNGTSGGAEIVTGALKDHRRATIVGETTSGTGTIQTFFPMADGSTVALSISLILTPNGHTVDSNGITPHLSMDYQNAQYDSEDQLIAEILKFASRD